MSSTIGRDGGSARDWMRMYHAADRLPPRNNHKAKLALVGSRFALGHRPVGTACHGSGYPVDRKYRNWRGLFWQRRASRGAAAGQHDSRVEKAEPIRSSFPHVQAPQQAVCFSGIFPGMQCRMV